MNSQVLVEKKYQKEFYNDGSIKAEGWIIENQKIGYWYTYYPNGNIMEQGHFRNNKKDGYWYFYSQKNNLIKEGHFINDKAEKWWIIYDIATSNRKDKITKKYQYRNNKKNGYCLLYKNDKLFKAEKYINDQKTGEWTDVFSFKKDNPNASL
ncbi:toxin-antitoxin system YwqK family antitoxin [Aquimarina sp. SS2-1]|uniref:toxin-antitoxin system YwqK family antitoxin n=1 Tax=Aquimarina besae TaxID=3342247 RepID=UPI00366A77B8